MTDYSRALHNAADEYRAAEAQLNRARDNLAATIRAAYFDTTKKADVLRGINYEWSRTHLDDTIIKAWWNELDDALRQRLLAAVDQPHLPTELIPELAEAGVAVQFWRFAGEMEPVWPRGLKHFLAERKPRTPKEPA
ncbi:hypothetical protein [Catenuloplanes indicus]|uniref:Uncharacterized protein n=1 Tax=Catenuloplanes indicus TaxID=137267 RepID=A0AAE3W9D0_9ACTN|nr:hypothetical protein [Catenuloplanes indicus]MDQ0363375.1 hypothetical protein [Catenuloplanes indicus]MDQ0371697.1 hypothetical protein [Catenuloplanes indicus]